MALPSSFESALPIEPCGNRLSFVNLGALTYDDIIYIFRIRSPNTEYFHE